MDGLNRHGLHVQSGRVMVFHSNLLKVFLICQMNDPTNRFLIFQDGHGKVFPLNLPNVFITERLK